MSGAAFSEDKIPKQVLLAMGMLVVFALLAVAAARILPTSDSAAEANRPVAERSLRFADRADGGIDVIDETTRKGIAQVEPGTNGFLRSTLRGLARERKRRDLGDEVPFVLEQQPDGRLTVFDAATQRRIVLDSFGPTNANVFRHFLPGSQSLPAAPGITLTKY